MQRISALSEAYLSPTVGQDILAIDIEIKIDPGQVSGLPVAFQNSLIRHGGVLVSHLRELNFSGASVTSFDTHLFMLCREK